MVLIPRFSDNFIKESFSISELREEENMSEVTRKIIDLCDLDLNFPSALFSRFLILLIVSIGVIFGFIVVVWSIMITALIYLFVVAYFSPSWSAQIPDGALEKLMIILLFLLPWYFGSLFNKWIQSINIAEKLKNHILMLYAFCRQDPKGVRNIDEILKQSKKVQWIVSFMITAWKLKFVFSDTSQEKIKILISMAISFSQTILRDLRLNLIDQITDQQYYLESAKSEIINNLNQTPELLRVSELQKLRLDRQIEQFEKLQQRLA